MTTINGTLHIVRGQEDTQAVPRGERRRGGHICSIAWAELYLPRPTTASPLTVSSHTWRGRAGDGQGACEMTCWLRHHDKTPPLSMSGGATNCRAGRNGPQYGFGQV